MNLKRFEGTSGRESHSCSRCSSWCSASPVLRAWQLQLPGGSIASVQNPAPNGDNGTTIDPLQYNCGNDAPTCGQVGESNGYYNGTNVDLLYSENYYCDANVTSCGDDRM